MKRLKHLFTALLLLCVAAVSAEDFSSGGIYYNITSSTDKTVEVTYRGYYYNSYSNEYSGSVTIPSTVTYNGTTYSVTSIGSSAFYGCSGLTSVTIPNSVTEIGFEAFKNCSNLKELDLQGIPTLAQGAFSRTGLEEVILPEGITSIPSWGFDNSPNLKKIVIPNSVTSIGSSAFEGCSGLKTIINYSNLTFTKYSTDYGYVACYADEVINAPNGTIVGDFIFSTVDGKHTLAGYLGNASEIVLPENYNGDSYSIGNEVFKNKTSITGIVIPNSVTSIGSSAFEGCNNIKYLEINTSATGIIFSGMKSLRELVIGNDVENIPDNAFSGCSNLSSVTVGSKIKEIKSNSFNNCDNIAKVFWLTNTPPNGYENLTGKINYVSNKQYTELENKVVTQFLSSNFEIDGIEYIPTSLADRKCCVVNYNPSVNNTNVEIPSIVTYQGVELTVDDIMPYAFYKNEVIEAVAFENKGMVGESAFEGCNNLARVEIPQSITRIEDHAFRNCTALTDAFFIDRETLLPLGAQLFAECPLDTLYIGSKIEYISEASESTSPFCGNKSLKTVIITDVETDIYDYEFYNCSGLETAVVGDGVEKIGRWTFSGCSSLKNFTFGSNVSTIGEEAFSDCTAVSNITGRAVQPPVCGDQALDDINKWECTLSVPSQNKSSYETAEQWKEFVKIKDIVTTDNYVTYMLEGKVYKTLLLTPGKRIIAPYVADKEEVPFAGWDLDEYMQDVTIDGPTKTVTKTITKTVTRIDTIRTGEITEKPINIKDNADEMMYTNAPCTNTQYGDAFKGWYVLFDGDTSKESMFHSEYADKDSEDGLDHYLRVDMGEGKSIGRFKFTYTNREGVNAMGVAPKTMIVEGSNEANGTYTEITTLTGLSNAPLNVYNSEVLGNDSNPYRYIRFRVTENQGGANAKNHPSFAISEFGMTKVEDSRKEEYKEVTETITEEVTETVTEKITLRYPVMPDKDIIVYGSYEVNEYTVTYIVDGEIYKTATVEYGAQIPAIETPTKAGYTFSGWSEIPATMPDKDITITGSFILIDTAIDGIEGEEAEKVVYDLNGHRILDTENLERGVYIINGKKRLIK